MGKTRPITIRKDYSKTFPNRPIADTNRTFFATNTTRIVMDLRVALTFTHKYPFIANAGFIKGNPDTSQGCGQ
jgi:hypothetical protein